MGKLLIDQPPLQVLPGLATKLGLNEAIVFQQLHYWLERSTNIREGKKWVYNDYEGWQEQFPFWSERTIQRIFLSLEKLGLIISKQFEKFTHDPKKRNRRKWYTIDYGKFEELEKTSVDKSFKPVPILEDDNLAPSKKDLEPAPALEDDNLASSKKENPEDDNLACLTENTPEITSLVWSAEDWPLIKVLGDEGYDPDTDSAISIGKIAKAEQASSDQLREAIQELSKQKTFVNNPFGWIRTKLRELKSRDELYFKRVKRKSPAIY